MLILATLQATSVHNFKMAYVSLYPGSHKGSKLYYYQNYILYKQINSSKNKPVNPRKTDPILHCKHHNSTICRYKLRIKYGTENEVVNPESYENLDPRDAKNKYKIHTCNRKVYNFDTIMQLKEELKIAASQCPDDLEKLYNKIIEEAGVEEDKRK